MPIDTHQAQVAALSAEVERRGWDLGNFELAIAALVTAMKAREVEWIATAATVLAALDPDAVKVEIFPDRVRVHRDGLVKVPPAGDGYEYVLVKRKDA